ncbi:MAG: hypothetical protein IJV28_05230 [Paludibacteraceae bacterium]|nr:hypothetical protein [Paludibacteraceae bacterium]
MAEIEAIVKQVSHHTWEKTTESYREKSVYYLVNKANEYLSKPTKTAFLDIENVIAPIIPILGKSPSTLFYNGKDYIILANDMYWIK